MVLHLENKDYYNNMVIVCSDKASIIRHFPRLDKESETKENN